MNQKNAAELIKNIPSYNGPGVYALIDENGKKYIGSSIHVHSRILAHLSTFRKILKYGENRHRKDYVSNYYLCDAIKSGAVFSAVVIEKLKQGGNIYELVDLERFYLEKAGGLGATYNMYPVLINRDKDYNLRQVWENMGCATEEERKCVLKNINEMISQREKPIYYT